MAAGLGTRMRSAVPKHLHPLLGRRLVEWVIRAAEGVGAEPVVVVTSPDARESFPGRRVAVQEHALGTGDAVRAGRSELEGFDGDVLVLNGDVPGLTKQLLADLVQAHRDEDAAATVLSFEPVDVRAYGRIVRDADGHLARIVESGDASDDELGLGDS